MKSEMSKKERHKQELAVLFDEFLRTGDEGEIIKYLLSNSNLPGPRGNLELARGFVGLVGERSTTNIESLWDFCLKLTRIPPEEAPVKDPREFLPFCGACGIGIIGSTSHSYFSHAIAHLKEMADDPRWRIRESVAIGIQELITKEDKKTLEELESWILNDNWLAMRAVAAGVAEPALLKNKQTAISALELHKKILDRIIDTKEHRSEEFKKLKKGLGYSLSVVVCAIPEEGFEYMHQLVGSGDAEIEWIIKENLKKNRLIRNFPDEVALIKDFLQ